MTAPDLSSPYTPRLQTMKTTRWSSAGRKMLMDALRVVERAPGSNPRSPALLYLTLSRSTFDMKESLQFGVISLKEATAAATQFPGDDDTQVLLSTANTQLGFAHMVMGEPAKAEGPYSESVRIREDARLAGQREGFAAGQIDGRKQGHDEAVAAAGKQLSELASRWSKTLELLHQHMPAHVADAKTDLVRLSLAIAPSTGPYSQRAGAPAGSIPMKRASNSCSRRAAEI